MPHFVPLCLCLQKGKCSVWSGGTVHQSAGLGGLARRVVFVVLFLALSTEIHFHFMGLQRHSGNLSCSILAGVANELLGH